MWWEHCTRKGISVQPFVFALGLIHLARCLLQRVLGVKRVIVGVHLEAEEVYGQRARAILGGARLGTGRWASICSQRPQDGLILLHLLK